MKSLVSFALALALAFTGLAFASPAIFLSNAASPIIPVQNYENQELWRDLQTGQTPPEAAAARKGRHKGRHRKSGSEQQTRPTARGPLASGMLQTTGAQREGRATGGPLRGMR